MENSGIPQDLNAALVDFEAGAEEIFKSFVANLESQQAPAVIYHYTDDVGFRGILETGRLWLSDIFSLNDPSELSHGMSHAVNILNCMAEKGPAESKIFAKDFATFQERGVEGSAHYFVCSFSADGDDLGQEHTQTTGVDTRSDLTARL